MALLCLGACRDTSLVSPDRTWVLTSLNDRPPSAPATLVIPDQGKLHGKAPCNFYSGSWSGVDADFRTENLRSTQMICPEIGTEARYLALLSRITSAELDGKELTLSGPGAELRFSIETPAKPQP